MDEEQAEREIAKMEQQLSKTERKLLGNKNEHRDWFQTKKQREDEKQRLSLTTPEDGKSKKPDDKNKKRKRPEYGGDGEDGPPVKELNAKKKKKEEVKRVKTPEQLAKERAMKEIEKVSLVRAKISKLRKRPGKLSAVTDIAANKGGSLNKPRRGGNSAFTNDLTDVSRSGALRLRSEANRHQKMSKIAKKKGVNSSKPIGPKKKTSNVKLANKAGKNKFNKGKNFGGPRFTKKDKNKKK